MNKPQPPKPYPNSYSTGRRGRLRKGFKVQQSTDILSKIAGDLLLLTEELERKATTSESAVVRAFVMQEASTVASIALIITKRIAEQLKNS